MNIVFRVTSSRNNVAFGKMVAALAAGCGRSLHPLDSSARGWSEKIEIIAIDMIDAILYR